MPMDQSARSRMPCPPRPISSVSPPPTLRPQNQTDQRGLTYTNAQSGASPTLATGIAMLTAQMQTLETHPDFTLSISIGIGSYRRTAELHNGTWQGHDLTHHFDDNRSSLRYDKPARPPHTATLRPDFQQTSPVANPVAPITRINPPSAPVATQQIACLLPAMPPPTLASTSASASTCVRRLDDSDPQLMLPSTFRGEGVEEAGTSVQNTDNTTQNAATNQAQRTVVMRNPLDVPILKDVVECQDSYDALLPPTDPQHLIGFQANPELQEQQKIHEKTERQAARAPIDLRDVLNQKEQNKIEQLVQKKRARELANTNTPSTSSSHSPVQQPEARRVRFSDELLSQTEARQLDIATRDAVRLRREAKSRDPSSGIDEQKFDTATSKGDPENVRNLEKATIGVHYLRPVKKPTLPLDHIPQWFERVEEDLRKDRSSLMRPLLARTRLDMQRPARYDEQLLRGRDFKRDLAALLPMGKEMLQKTRIALLIDSTMKATANMHSVLMDVRVMNLPCTSLEEMAEVTCKVFGPTANHAETIPFPPVLIYSNVIDHLAL